MTRLPGFKASTFVATLKETSNLSITSPQRAEAPQPPAAPLTIETEVCGRKEDELCKSRGFRACCPQKPTKFADPGPPKTPISLRGMEQIFPRHVDNIDPVELYAMDRRAGTGDRPWVLGNMISSIDGGIAIDGVSGGLGGSADKSVFGAIRAVPDVIMVASGTVIAENYRAPQTPEPIRRMRVARGQAPAPRIAIVTRSLSIDPQHRVFDPLARPIIITTTTADGSARSDLEAVADIVAVGEDTVDLEGALIRLGELGTDLVLLEGGPTLNGAFVDADLVDELCLSFAPMMLGGSSPRIVARSENTEPRPFVLDRTLHENGYLFHRYLRNTSS